MAKILVTDADPEECELIVFALRVAGHEVRGVTNVEDVYQQAQDNKPDLILIDANLLFMQGYEAWEAIKQDKNIADIPVILLVERGMLADLREDVRSEAAGLFFKPVSPDNLSRQVNFYIKRMGKSQ